MICPNCHWNNRPTAKVCGHCGTPLPSAPARKRPWASLAIGCVLLMIGTLFGIGGGWVALQMISRPAPTETASPTGTSIATPGASQTITSTRVITSTPAITPTIAITSTSATTPTRTVTITPAVAPTRNLTPAPTILPIPTVPVIAGDRRLDPTADRRGVVVTDLSNNKQYPVFTIPIAGTGTVLSAAWSEDGKQILISYYWHVSDFDYGNTVRLLDEGDSAFKDVVTFTVSQGGMNAGRAYRDAIWSADGAKIAVRYQYQSDFGIWLFDPDGTGGHRLQSSAIGDWPRFVSVDKRWVIGVSSQDNQLYAESLTDGEHVAFEKIKGIRMYDQRYFPWRITLDMVCDVSGAWYEGFGAYWDCH